MFKWNYESPAGAGPHRARPFGEFDACLGGWDIPGEPYTVGAGQRVPVVPRADARRPDQPLGPHRPALRPLGLQGAEPRRPGRRLADLLRRRQALLRPAGPAGGPLRHERGDRERARRASSCPPRAHGPTSSWSRRPATSSGSPASPRASPSSRSRTGAGAACHYCSQCGRGCTTHSIFTTPTRAAAPGPRHRAGSRSAPGPWSARSRPTRTASARASPTSTPRPGSTSRCGPGWWCWPRAPASRRASS